MIAHGAGDQHRIAGRTFRADIATPSRTIPKPVVEMKTPSPLPRSTTLVSPVTIRTPATRAASAMEQTMRCRSASAHAFLQDEADRQREGVRPAHGDVVDRAVDGERADIAAREEQRRDDEAVGGDGEAARRGRSGSPDPPPPSGCHWRTRARTCPRSGRPCRARPRRGPSRRSPVHVLTCFIPRPPALAPARGGGRICNRRHTPPHR
jgi:hypothetical protein